ncbi:glutamine amidotransferase [Roseibium hamelinense]|uniref:Glutamine amidotransferase n=1 Tax=Roseibium hamelinense TaxID=150831 RepID=A0A562TIU3_9HYPH|nr:class II glutamine amidotransferase [Roseibium hamelinense]MTI43093.1 class II glutamine amidotransferase [Roseibium hamelinense]TWI92560.1 glutamine amidotransferase [Roseibium hamelinense]
MCRWAAWSGAPKYLEELICDPQHSLIEQSRHALSCKTSVNADGFGAAWYGERLTPCVYKDVRPAWSDPNLLQLAHHVKASVFLAHVRASTGTATVRDNCHPFTVGRWSFMHNGQIGGYDHFRRRIDNLIPDALYAHRTGATDSEALFLIACGYGLSEEPVPAMARAVRELEDMARTQGGAPFMRFASCWSDGETLYAARYASDHLAPTLYYRCYGDGISIVSEPLDEAPGEWLEVESGSFIAVRNGTVSVGRFFPDKVASSKGNTPKGCFDVGRGFVESGTG